METQFIAYSLTRHACFFFLPIPFFLFIVPCAHLTPERNWDILHVPGSHKVDAGLLRRPGGGGQVRESLVDGEEGRGHP